MKITSAKTLLRKSRNFRNESAYKKLAELDERLENKDDYPRPVLFWKVEKKVAFSTGVWNFIRSIMQP